jgi:hypothetical protein
MATEALPTIPVAAIGVTRTGIVSVTVMVVSTTADNLDTRTDVMGPRRHHDTTGKADQHGRGGQELQQGFHDSPSSGADR